MRVTNSMLVSNMMRNYSKNMKSLQQLQNELSSRQRVTKPSDDPVATSKAMKIKSDLAQNEQYITNADNALSWLDTTEIALKDLGDVIHRVRELTVKGSTGSTTADDKQKIADEIDQLMDHVVQIGNSTYAGRYIFSGYKTNTAPFEVDAGTGDLNYNGDNGNIDFEIGIGARISVNVAGDNNGADINGLYGVLKDLSENLRTDAPDTNDFLSKLDEKLNVVLAQRSAVGAKTNRFELIKSRLLDEKTNFSSLLSQTIDADIAKTIMELKEAENTYNTSLSVGGRIIMPTLVDFIR